MTVAVTGGAAAVASWILYGSTPGYAMTAATAAAVLLAGANPRGSDVGWVYIIHAPRKDLYKLGWSTDPHARRERLEADAGMKLRLIAYGPGARVYEKSLHDRYADRWMDSTLPHASEWFALSRQEAADVAAELRRRN